MKSLIELFDYILPIYFMKRCVLCAEFCDICDVFLRMNVAKCAMRGVQDAASLSKIFHLTEGVFFFITE